MNADGSGVERLTFQGKYNQTPDWSPRGDVIAFTARDERNVFDLFTVDVKTKTIKRLTQDQGNNEEPSFSPNGRHVVFTSTRDRRQRLYLMNADGTNQRPLPIDDATTPAWGPFAE
jgi:TolB protein